MKLVMRVGWWDRRQAIYQLRVINRLVGDKVRSYFTGDFDGFHWIGRPLERLLRDEHSQQG